MTKRAIQCCLAAAVACAVTAPAAAQTSTPGPGIDVEIYDANGGGNWFCAAPGDTVWAYLYVGPAIGAGSSIECAAPCGSALGGPANIAAATIDVAFDPDHLAFFSAFNNGFMGAVGADGLLQLQSLAAGRVGWALAGDWTPDGDTSGTLADPCQMSLLDQPGWMVRLGFNVRSAGTTQIDLRNEPDFPLAFADICGSEVFTSSNGGIDEVRPATVSTGSPDCPHLDGVIFRNGFETGDVSAWP